MPKLWDVPERTKLKPTEIEQPEDEIIAKLCTYRPPGSSERNVWAYWHTGLATMPSWCVRNVVGWVRLLGPRWTIRVLDNVEGSPNNFRKYLTPEHLPESVNSDKMTGKYAATHTSDFLRLPLLYVHGGVWLDVGIVLIRHLENGVWNVLEDPDTPFEFSAFAYAHRPGRLAIINPWLAAKRGCQLVEKWHRTFVHVWGDSTECTGLSSHALLRHLEPWPVGADGHKSMDKEQQREASKSIMDYGTQLLCLERLTDYVDKTDGFDARSWIKNKAILFPALEEMWLYQLRTSFSGTKQFTLLTTNWDETDVSKRSAAEEFAKDVLANSMMMKLCHGAGVMESNLADIWDNPQHEGSDCDANTFAGYLRWGSVHLSQERVLQPVKLAFDSVHPPRVGMFEPVPLK